MAVFVGRWPGLVGPRPGVLAPRPVRSAVGAAGFCGGCLAASHGPADRARRLVGHSMSDPLDTVTVTVPEWIERDDLHGPSESGPGNAGRPEETENLSQWNLAPKAGVSDLDNSHHALYLCLFPSVSFSVSVRTSLPSLGGT